MMDISSQTSPRQLPGGRVAVPVDIAPGALSFHLRIAGAFRTPAADSVEYARVRTILDFEFILQVEGRTWLSYEDLGCIEIVPGDVIFTPPGVLTGWAYRTGLHRAAHFDFVANPAMRAFENLRPTGAIIGQPKYATELPIFELAAGDDPTPLRLPFVTPVLAPALWSERMATLARLYDQPRAPSLSDAVQSSESIGWMLRTLAADAAKQGLTEPTRQDSKLRDLVRALESGDDPAAELPSLSVAALARRADMGETAFRAAFRTLTGVSPRDYIEQRRIARAKHLLAITDRSVKAVAMSEGYDDVYHFSRVFKRVTGVAPSEFRRTTAGT